MTEAEFVALVRDILGAIGQRLEAARPVAEGLALRTADGFLYVFVADASRGSLASVRSWCEEEDVPMNRLVVFSLGELPADWAPEVARRGGTVVVGDALARLVDNLGIDTPLVPRPEGGVRADSAALPSAQELEAQMRRADTWWAAGVFPLALRFYTAATELKPEYLAAHLGRARSLAALGRGPEARRAWEQVLALRPGLLEGEIGAALATGAGGDRRGERAQLARLVSAHPQSWEAQIAYIAVLIDDGSWAEARGELRRALIRSEQDGRLHFLLGVALERTGDPDGARREWERARRLGLSADDESRLRALAERTPRSPTDPPQGF